MAGYPNIFAESTITVDALQAIKLQGKRQLKPEEADQSVTEAVYASGKRTAILDGLHYSSLNEHIATINEQGLVQAHQEGSTVISVTYREFASEYNLVVTNDEAPILTEITMDGRIRWNKEVKAPLLFRRYTVTAASKNCSRE